MNVTFKTKDGHVFSKEYTNDAELVDELNYFFIRSESKITGDYYLVPVTEITKIFVVPID